MSVHVRVTVAMIRAEIEAVATPERKEWSEKYLKNAVTCLGATTPQVEDIARTLLPALKAMPLDGRFLLGTALLDQDVFELQSIGVMILHRDLKHFPAHWLDVLEPVFDRRATNWATADGIAGRILRGRLTSVADRTRIVSWSKQESPWKRRLACVGFVNEAKKGLYAEEIRIVVEGAMALDHRFSQLGAGWLLRERWRAAPDEVEGWLYKNATRIRREALRYAIEKMPPEKQKVFLAL